MAQVVNELDQPASIHWHGMYQNGTNNMDGIPGLTQDAIMPGTAFVYNYTLDVAGSYWYHSHWKTQYTDGLFGSLVVLDPAADLPHHPVSIIGISDLYYNNSLQLTKAFLSPANTEGDEPIPDSCTMNGLGQLAGCAAAGTCKYGSTTLGLSKPCSCDEPVEACRARGGVTRLMNQAAFATMNITVDEHLFWIVGADSVPIKPTALVGTIRLNTGECERAMGLRHQVGHHQCCRSILTVCALPALIAPPPAGQRYDVVMCRKVNTHSTAPAWSEWSRASQGQHFVSRLVCPVAQRPPPPCPGAARSPLVHGPGDVP